MAKLRNWIEAATGIAPDLQDRLLETLVTIVALWALRKLLLRVIARQVAKRGADSEGNRLFYEWSQGTAYVSYVLAFLLIGRIWIASFASLATVLGLLSAGLAVALKDPLLNIAGWLYIMWRKPFELGNRIEIGEYQGDVVGQSVFTFSLMEIGRWVDADDRTGRLLAVPNGMVFVHVVANYSKGWFEQIWNEVGVLVTFESRWRDARDILMAIAVEHGEQAGAAAAARAKHLRQEYLVLAANLEPRVIVTVADSGVMLTLRYMCLPFERRRSAEKIWIDVLEAFGARDDIDFAYPTVRYYDNRSEGKRPAQPPA